MTRPSSVPPPVTAVLDASSRWLPARMAEVEAVLREAIGAHGEELGQGDPETVAAHGIVVQAARVAAGAEMLRSEVQDPLAQGLGGEPDGVAYAQ